MEERFPEDEITVILTRKVIEALVTMGVEVELPEKPCIECGRKFTPRYMIGSSHLWCSERCVSETRRKRKLADAQINHPSRG